LRHGGGYLYCYSTEEGVAVKAAQTLKEVMQQGGRTVWQPEEGKPWSKDIWAPELHRINDRWHIYVAADDGQNANHRMYVLAGTEDDPTEPFSLAGQLSAEPDRWAIDGTVLMHRGEPYFIWSGWEGDVDVAQQLYIARMESPTALADERVMISQPEHEWESSVYPINEGPEALVHGDRTFVVYSANASWSDHYCLGLLELVGADPVVPDAWKKKTTPVFAATESVFGPGHCSFFRSPDGREDWIVYHTAKRSGSGWDREGHAQSFGWGDDGGPRFGAPVASGVEMRAPSGE
jgi:GH43 family beta-xylosidase